MAFIEKFLGKRVEIPEDLRYSAKQGLWARISDQDIVFGFSEPWLVLNNGINDIEWITSEGKGVHKGDTVVFAITGKISYIDAPTGGIIHFNPEVKQDPSLVAKAPYGKGWLFRIRIDQPPDHTFINLLVPWTISKVLGARKDTKTRRIKGWSLRNLQGRIYGHSGTKTLKFCQNFSLTAHPELD